MVNKNDLRFIKTEKLIEETYLALKMKSRSPVKVSELCKAALINKTTFYLHYETMEALHEYICRKEIETMLADCPHVDEAFTNTEAFVRAMVRTIQANASISKTLFGDDLERQTSLFEKCLVQRYLHGTESQEVGLKIIFAIGGAARLLIGDQSQERIRVTIGLIGKIF
mgnify:CR=1 FL=1